MGRHFFRKTLINLIVLVLVSFLPIMSHRIKFSKTYSSDEVVKKRSMKIHIEGLKIFDQDNNEVWLKGITSNEFRNKEKIYKNLDDFKEKVLFFKEKGINLIVLYLDTPSVLDLRREEIIDLVKWASWNNLYVLLCPVVNEIDTVRAEIVKKIKYGPGDERLNDLMSYFSSELHFYDNVLYGTGAEPHGVEIKKLIQKQDKLINVIRNNKSDAIVVINGLDWGSNLNPYLDNPTRIDNILYDLHYYPSNNRENLKLEYCKIENDYETKLPFMLGEFGGVYQKDFGSSEDLECFKLLLDELKNKQISFSVFTLDDNTDLGLYTDENYNEKELSEKGKILVEYLEE